MCRTVERMEVLQKAFYYQKQFLDALVGRTPLGIRPKDYEITNFLNLNCKIIPYIRRSYMCLEILVNRMKISILENFST